MISLASIDRLLLEAWLVTPCPLFNPSPLLVAAGLEPRLTYRERLDAQPCNVFGDPIPRIVTVRHNLARLKAGASR